MVKGVTESGFAFEIDEKRVNDYRVLKALRHLDNGKFTEMVDLMDLLFPEEMQEKILKFVETDGQYPIDKVATLMGEILSYNGETKNS